MTAAFNKLPILLFPGSAIATKSCTNTFISTAGTKARTRGKFSQLRVCVHARSDSGSSDPATTACFVAVSQGFLPSHSGNAPLKLECEPMSKDDFVTYLPDRSRYEKPVRWISALRPDLHELSRSSPFGASHPPLTSNWVPTGASRPTPLPDACSQGA